MYKRLAVGTMCLTCIAAGIATASFSFSWFSNTNNVTRQIEGRTAGAYFAGGSGEKDDPYIINSQIHLYNLAWLYYIGYFKDKEPYFVIEKNIDMSGWTLPPIGTSTNPFNGHIDGNGYSIKGLTVSNDFTQLKNRKPSNISEDDWNGTSTNKDKYGPTPNIMGLFGYVGKESSDKAPSIENIHINNETVKSTTSSVLTGIVAGYVDGSLDSILIDNSAVDVKDGSLPIGTLNSETISNISAYTSVGYCTEKYRTKYNRYETTLYEPTYVASTSQDTYTPGGSGGGHENDWGGTIDFYDIHKRLTFMVNSKLATTSSGITKYGDELQTQRGAGKTDYTTNSSSFGTFEYTTLIPINITNEITQDYYDSNASESINATTNNGYIAGTNSKSTNFTVQARKINEDSYNVSKSFNDKTTYTKYTTDNGESNLSLMTILPTTDNSSPIYQINDEHNTNTNLIDSSLSRNTYQNLGLNKYKSVRENLNNIYGESPVNNGTMINHYLRWGSNFNINSESAISSWPTFTGKAQIEGKSYDSYEFLRAAINFTAKETGIFVAIFTPWGTDNRNFTMNGLVDVTRDSNGKATSKKRIDKVYKDSNGKIKYSYSDSTTKSEDGYNSSSETLAYSFSNWNVTTTNVIYGMYYCEIPVMTGDYVFARCDISSGYAGCTYNYIDIGANAGDEGSSGNLVTRTKVFELLEQITQAFTYPTGVYVADFDNAVLDTKTLCITLGSTYSGSAKIERTNNDVDVTVTTDTSNNTGLAYFDSKFETVSKNNVETTLSDVNEGETNIKTKRMTYYDCSSTSLTMFRFSQTSTDGGEYSSISAETQYQASVTSDDDGNITLGTFEETSDQTVYNDDGTKADETNNIPSDIVTGITQPTDFSTSSNAYNLKLLVNKEGTLTNEYLPSINVDADKKAKVAGYALTIKNNGTDVAKDNYSVTKNDNYSLTVNNETI